MPVDDATAARLGRAVVACAAFALTAACGSSGEPTGVGATDPAAVATTVQPQTRTTESADPGGSVPSTAPATTQPGPTNGAEDGPGIVELRPVIACGEGLTPPDPATGQAALPRADGLGKCLVGPSGGTGEVFAAGSARAEVVPQTGQWVVNVDLSDDGQIVWDNLAQMCFSGAGDCPSRQLAIVLDGVIQSAPTVQTPDFPGNVQISGAFSEEEVRALARAINRGADPAVDEEPPAAGGAVSVSVSVDQRSQTLKYSHPALGPVTITLEGGTIDGGPFGVSPIVRATQNSTGRVLFEWIAPEQYEAFGFAGLADGADVAGPVDRRGHVFFDWNPGRFNGVSVLVPTDDGFDSIGTLTNDFYDGFYYAFVVDVDGDGEYEIDQNFQICEPTCAGGIYYSHTWRWDGSTYSGRSDPPADSGQVGSDPCAPDRIQADLGPGVEVVEGLCEDGWALVGAAGPGDTWFIAQLSGEAWTTYVAFPTPMCRSEAQAAGVPDRILDRIGWSCDQPGSTSEAPVVAWDGVWRPAPQGRIVQLGQFGDQVTLLQDALVLRGYAVDVDGYFGYGTEAVVRQFQRDRDLTVNGIATNEVWNQFGE